MGGQSRTLYRAMLPTGDSPNVGTDRNMLGLRPKENDLSVYVDARRIMQPIRPKNVLNVQGQPGANGETVLFSINEDELPAFGLKLGTVKPDTHGPIEPNDACDHDELHKRIVSTLPKWKKVKL